jgi:glucosamine--fructose-6-phosphate aminotransferase (isomerizing)
MCGIFGYVGKGHCRDFILEGLSRLEYRGYDSAGFVCIDREHGHLNYVKEVGRISVLKRSLEKLQYDGVIGLGHTRWATHGVTNQQNSHPHFNCQKTIAVVHNGIIEGYEKLRKQLSSQGHEFYSSTDTEVIVHVLSMLLDQGKPLPQALVQLAGKLQGAYACVFLLEKHPDKLVVMRRRSPLAIGVGDGEMFVGSDYLAFSDKTKNVLFMPEESFAILTKSEMDLYDFRGASLPIKIQKIDAAFSAVSKEGFEHYMLKEIYEQKKAIDKTITFYRMLAEGNRAVVSGQSKTAYQQEMIFGDDIWNQLGVTAQQICDLKSIHLIGAGTSWHAARIAQFFFEIIAKIPTRVSLGSEFRYMPYFPKKSSVCLCITQSGETADTLEALRLVSGVRVPTIALTNVASSTVVREATGALLMQAGPEISVCSTKAFSTQLASLYWLANRVALQRGTITAEQAKQAHEDLFVVAEVLESTIESYKWEITNDLAKKYSRFAHFIFLGRHISYPFAMEAALKLKEISYLFAQCYPAGELKHGPIALIDENTPVVIFSVLDYIVYHKLVANAQEVKARNGHLVVFAFEGQDELIELADTVIVVPRVAPLLGPLAMTGVMQFLVYQITKELGYPIDKPRNLAKSVTVE